MSQNLAATGRHAGRQPFAPVRGGEETGARRVEVVVALSMLHEPAAKNSATRLFRGEPVLMWTLRRLGGSARRLPAVVLCWDDQSAATQAAGEDAQVLSQGSRTALPQFDAITAARQWADGWRGGPLSTCHFDLGFHGPAVLAAAGGADAVVLVDPAAGLVDPALIDSLVAQAESHPHVEFCFAPAAPGLTGVLLKRPLLERLAAAGTHPGRMLHYQPDVVSREPLAGEACAPVPTSAARTTHRFDLSSDRQIARLSAATAGLNGELAAAGAEELARRVQAADPVDALPRDVVLELNTARLSRPIFWPGRYQPIGRPDLRPELADALIDELATLDGARLTLAGVGDPLLSPDVFRVIARAAAAGVAVHVETDLLGPDVEAVRRLAASEADVVSVHVPALTDATYEMMMGTSGYRRVLEHLQAFVAERAGRGRAVPLVAAVFTKCRDNLAEMEGWYDQWLRAVGTAVVSGPSEYAGLVPDVAAADMEPPRRRPCARLSSRLTVLSDGRIVSCEQDILGRQVLGAVGDDRLTDVWQRRFGGLRDEHRTGNWSSRPVCAGCKEWHRP